MCNLHNYIINHIWNYYEINFQTRWQSRVQMLAKIGSQQVYNTIPKSKEWLIITYAINDAWGFLLRFYIFKGERIKDNYIRNCKLGTCIHARKTMDDMFYVQLISESNP
jgi:hypothetical protein